jgi:hypothetical protein
MPMKNQQQPVPSVVSQLMLIPLNVEQRKWKGRPSEKFWGHDRGWELKRKMKKGLLPQR